MYYYIIVNNNYYVFHQTCIAVCGSWLVTPRCMTTTAYEVSQMKMKQFVWEKKCRIVCLWEI